MNEPNLFAEFGYATGKCAPGRCSKYIGNCTSGNSATEPYLVQHPQLLAHATAVKLYRDKFQSSQKGKIGISAEARWSVPKYETDACRDAASRALDFTFGWTVHPVVYGEYPETTRALVGNRLPNFTKAQSEMLKGSFGFLGVNYYTANYAEDNDEHTSTASHTTDVQVTLVVPKYEIDFDS